MKYLAEAAELKDAAIAYAMKHVKDPRDISGIRDVAAAISKYERVVCALADDRASRAELTYNEGLLSIRDATARVVAGYIEQVAQLKGRLDAVENRMIDITTNEFEMVTNLGFFKPVEDYGTLLPLNVQEVGCITSGEEVFVRLCVLPAPETKKD